MLNIFKKLFPSANEKEVKRLMKLVAAVNELEEKYKAMSDQEIGRMTDTKECEKYVLWVGNRRLIKRKPFEAYLQSEYSI